MCGIFPNRFKTVTFQNTSRYALFYNCKKESILQNMGVASRSSLLPDDTIFCVWDARENCFHFLKKPSFRGLIHYFLFDLKEKSNKLSILMKKSWELGFQL